MNGWRLGMGDSCRLGTGDRWRISQPVPCNQHLWGSWNAKIKPAPHHHWDHRHAHHPRTWSQNQPWKTKFERDDQNQQNHIMKNTHRNVECPFADVAFVKRAIPVVAMADPPTPKLAAAYPSTTKGWAQGSSSAHPRVHGGESGSPYARGGRSSQPQERNKAM